jgi:transcriptional regulator with XRE-family HTH domain
VAAGQQLRSLRERRAITVRQVQQASRRIAEASGDERYRISNGWLVQLEKCASPPNVHHLFALGATYRMHFFELLRLYGVNVEEQAKYEAIANPQLTQILSPADLRLDFASPRTTRLAPELATKLPVPLASERSNGHSHITYAQLGSNEVTMYPLIRPGSILAIDTTQKKVAGGSWINDFERPIYFVELRDRFTCGWCERVDNKLLILAYRSSSVQEFTYPHDVEIVGRVVAYYTPCVDLDAKQRVTTA